MKQSKDKRQASGLLTVFLLIASFLPLVAVTGEPVQAQTPKFDVKFDIDNRYITYKILTMTVQNLQDSPDDISMKTILHDTDFSISDVRDAEFAIERKETYQENVPDYDWIEYQYYDNDNNLIAENRWGIVGSHLEDRERLVWESKALVSKTEDGLKGELKHQWEEIPIGKAGTPKGTLRFRFEFSHPIVQRADGWGSRGVISLDLNGEIFVDLTGSSWWDESWLYRAPITLTTHPENYQIKVVLGKAENLGGHCLNNFDDLRFTENDNTELSFVFENYNLGDDVTAWFRRIDNDQTGGDKDNEVWVYFGNSSAANAESGDDVFPFFDEFDNDSKWSGSVGGYEFGADDSGTIGLRIIPTGATEYVIYSTGFTWQYGLFEMRARSTTAGAGQGQIYTLQHGSGDATGDYATGDRITLDYATDVITDYEQSTNHPYSFDTAYHIFGLGWLENNYLRVYADESYLGTNAHTPNSNYLKLDSQYSNTDKYIDWLRIRKYADPEPTATVGAIESLPVFPNAPTALLCEGQVDPTAVPDITPEFSAVYTDNYAISGDNIEIWVGTSGGDNSMWASGPIGIAPIENNERSQYVEYAGEALSIGTTYYWQCRFYSVIGYAGTWSEGATFKVSVAVGVALPELRVQASWTIPGETVKISALVLDADGDPVTGLPPENITYDLWSPQGNLVLENVGMAEVSPALAPGLYDNSHAFAVSDNLGTWSFYVEVEWIGEKVYDYAHARLEPSVARILDNLIAHRNAVENKINDIWGWVDTFESKQQNILDNLEILKNRVPENLSSSLDAIYGFTDELEAYVDTLESGQATLMGYTDAVESNQQLILDNIALLSGGQDVIKDYTDTLESGQSTIQGYVDEIEFYLGVTAMQADGENLYNYLKNTIVPYIDLVEEYSENIQNYVDTLEAGQTTIQNYVDTLESGQATIISKLDWVMVWAETSWTVPGENAQIAALVMGDKGWVVSGLPPENVTYTMWSPQGVKIVTDAGMVELNASGIYENTHAFAPTDNLGTYVIKVRAVVAGDNAYDIADIRLEPSIAGMGENLSNIYTYLLSLISTVGIPPAGYTIASMQENIMDYLTGTIKADLDSIHTDTQSILAKWGAYSASDLIAKLTSISDNIGEWTDAPTDNTVFGRLKFIDEILGVPTDTLADDLRLVKETVDNARSELGYAGKTKTAYADIQVVLYDLNVIMGRVYLPPYEVDFIYPSDAAPGEGVKLVLRLTREGMPLENRTVEFTVVTPDYFTKTLSAEEVSPGYYLAEFELPLEEGVYLLRAEVDHLGELEGLVSGSIQVSTKAPAAIWESFSKNMAVIILGLGLIFGMVMFSVTGRKLELDHPFAAFSLGAFAGILSLLFAASLPVPAALSAVVIETAALALVIMLAKYDWQGGLLVGVGLGTAEAVFAAALGPAFLILAVSGLLLGAFGLLALVPVLIIHGLYNAWAIGVSPWILASLAAMLGIYPVLIMPRLRGVVPFRRVLRGFAPIHWFLLLGSIAAVLIIIVVPAAITPASIWGVFSSNPLIIAFFAGIVAVAVLLSSGRR